MLADGLGQLVVCHAVELALQREEMVAYVGVRETSVVDLSIFQMAAEAVTPAVVREFIRQLAEERLHIESLTIELKTRRNKDNVAEAVSAFANTSGGLVIIGVDEDHPDKVPGVDREEPERLVNHLLGVLEPPFVPWMAVVAAADEPDKVVILLRVDLDALPDLPVVVRGRAYLRSPTRHDPANRQQLIDLVGRRGRASYDPIGQRQQLTSYMPPVQTGSDSDAALPTLRFRAASSVLLRPISMRGVALNDELRRTLTSCIDNSRLSVWARGLNPPQDQPEFWTPSQIRSNQYEATRTVSRRYPPAVTLGLELRLDGPSLSWRVDVNLDSSKESDPRGPVLRLGHAMAGLLNLIDLVRDQMRDSFERATREPVARVSETVVWLQPDDRKLDRRLGLDYDEVRRLVNNTVSAMHFQLAEQEDATAALAQRLEEMLLDAGCHEVSALVDETMTSFEAKRGGVPWV